MNENPNDIDLTSASLTVIAQSLVHCEETDLDKGEKILLLTFQNKHLELISLALKDINVSEIASNSFSSLTYAAMIHLEIWKLEQFFMKFHCMKQILSCK
jgi:hypothetical protein